MVFLSETIVESAETISKIVEIINILQPILDFMNSVGDILVWVISGIGFILCGKLIKPRLQFRRFVNSVYSQENLREVLKYYIHRIDVYHTVRCLHICTGKIGVFIFWISKDL